jgi:probable HAF family extracellular repeat protein
MSRSIVAPLALAFFALLPAAPSSGQSTGDLPIRVGTLGGVFSTLWAVNNDNAAVGWSDVTYTDSEHAILWQDGQLIDLGALPGDTVSRALGINDLGQVVGVSVNTDGWSRRVRAVLWERGQPIEIPGGDGCGASAINDRGHIAVRCGGPAWLWRDGQRVEVGLLPGYSSADITAINNAGVAVGSMYDGRGRATAFRWQDGVLTDLGALVGSPWSQAEAINARGQVAGYVQTSAGPSVVEPVIWEGNTVTPLGGGWGVFQGVARGINDRGEVVGSGDFIDRSGGGVFVWSRGTFRYLNPYFVVSDINERGTAVGRYSEDGWTAQGALVPKAGTRRPAAAPRAVPEP